MRSKNGFSLVEILVVVVIAALLAGITAAVYARMRVSAQRQATMAAMGFLYDANLRYQQMVPVALLDTDSAKYFIDFNNNGVKDGTDRAMTGMEYFIFRTWDNPDCQAQLNLMPQNMLVTERTATVKILDAANGLVRSGYTLRTVVDPWGAELKYRSLSNATRINANASIGEQDPAIPYLDYAFFSSAGPDGLWGTLTAHDDQQPDASAKDNLYSFTAHQ